MIKNNSSVLYRIFVQIVFIFLAVTILFALYYLVANSFKTSQEFDASQFSLPKSINFSNLKYVWTEGGIGETFKNSLIISGLSVIGCTVIAILASFAFTVIKFKGRNALTYFIIATMYISPMAIIIPLFLQMSKLKLTNTFVGIILIYIGIHLAFSVYLVTTYFKNVPSEITEAAIIDGCSNIGMLGRIYIPLSKAGLVVLSIINFSIIWNDLLFAFIFLQDPSKQTIMVSIAKFQGKYGVANMTHVMSALLIATIPSVLLYLAAQRFFRQGVMLGAIK